MTRRLLLSYVAVTLAVLTVLTVPLGIAYQRRLTQQLRSSLVQDAFILSAQLEDSLAKRSMSLVDTNSVRDYAAKFGVRVVAVDDAGMSLVDTDNPSESARSFSSRSEIAMALAGVVAQGSRRSDTLKYNLVYVAVPSVVESKIVGAVRLTFSTTVVEGKVRNYWLTLGLIALVSLTGAAALGVVLARSLTKPVRQLEDTAVAFGRGDLERRLELRRGPEEIRSLTASFNRMASRLHELISSQEAFVADASHQLRTPLTSLRLRLENLEVDAPEAIRAELESSINEVDRLSRMVDGLLVLARVDRQESIRSTTALDVAGLLRDRQQEWSALAEERTVTIEVDTDDGIEALVSADRLTQVIDNVVANSLDAIDGAGTVAGGRIVLRARRSGPDVMIQVIDDGPGLTNEQRARAFDRFWRADPSTQGIGGSGLGLSIVARLVAADGGKVALAQATGGGLLVSIAYPRVIREPGRSLPPPAA